VVHGTSATGPPGWREQALPRVGPAAPVLTGYRAWWCSSRAAWAQGRARRWPAARAGTRSPVAGAGVVASPPVTVAGGPGPPRAGRRGQTDSTLDLSGAGSPCSAARWAA